MLNYRIPFFRGSAKCPENMSQEDHKHIMTFFPEQEDPRTAHTENPLRYETWPAELQSIVVAIHDLVDNMCISQMNIAQDRTVWTEPYSDVFCNLFESVARPATEGQGWSLVLADGKPRCLAVRGVIMKALEATVFAEPLFGADDKFSKSFAETIPGNAGLQGAKNRGWHAISYVTNYVEGVPPNFWEKVDRAAVEILILLLPLYNLVKKTFKGPSLPVEKIHQDIHNIVARAAWLSISFRVAPVILEIKWPHPGTRSHWTQVNASDAIYSESAYRLGGSAASVARVGIVAVPNVLYHKAVDDAMNPGVFSQRLVEPVVSFYAGKPNDAVDQAIVKSLSEHRKWMEEIQSNSKQ